MSSERNQTQESRVIQALMRRGPSKAAEICLELKISQPTFSLVAARLKGRVRAIGKGKSTVYIALRKVRTLDHRIPLFKISSEGECSQLGELTAYEPRGYAFISKNNKTVLYPGIPYFLSDACPQGFMGRSFSKRHPELSLPTRLMDWNEDDFMTALALRGEDALGNLLVGHESYERYHAGFLTILDTSKRATSYVAAANAALEGVVPGSSAAGEQPKFLQLLKNKNSFQSALIKFSPPLQTEVGRRWADLLICESLALSLLAEEGVAASQNQILEAGNRVFLEVMRFDRVGKKGRIGVISLDAVDNEFFGHKDNWVAASTRLQERGFITEEDASTLRFLYSFSALIANTDCHFGNVSFFSELGSLQLKLTPCYDILPMLYAPIDGQIVKREFQKPIPKPDALEEFSRALPLAREFWKRVAGDSRISKDFRKIADENGKLLA